MGFETQHQILDNLHRKIIKQSLWDLKPRLGLIFGRSKKDNKAVPMGFETLSSHSFGLFDCVIIKQSLWDLKHQIKQAWDEFDAIIKQSLWDLKRVQRVMENIKKAIIRAPLKTPV